MEREVTTSAVVDCGEELKAFALAEFLKRSTAMDAYIKTWMGENLGRTGTTRAEFQTAVRLYLGEDDWTPRDSRPSTKSSVEFSTFVG